MKNYKKDIKSNNSTKLLIKGGNSARGIIDIPAAKNSVLPILACCIMCTERVVLHNIVPLSDIISMMDIIKHLGGLAELDGTDLIVDCSKLDKYTIDKTLTKDIRASVFVLGALCGRFKKAVVGLPGGCKIGKRPIDIHIKALQELNISMRVGDIIQCQVDDTIKGNTITLKYPSVGATENIIMAGVMAQGVTTIINAALEPEIDDLIEFINKCGGVVKRENNGSISIQGVDKLKGCNHKPIGDRIVAGTYLCLAAATKGDITVCGVEYNHLNIELEVMKNMGCIVSSGQQCIRVQCLNRLNAIPMINTAPYPGFATDLQPQFLTLLCLANGTSTVQERVFENRYTTIKHLRAMNANVEIAGDLLIINGVESLVSGKLSARDLRGGAALCIAATTVVDNSVNNINEPNTTHNNISIIENARYIDRGYYKIETVLTQCGVECSRIVE